MADKAQPITARGPFWTVLLDTTQLLGAAEPGYAGLRALFTEPLVPQSSTPVGAGGGAPADGVRPATVIALGRVKSAAIQLHAREYTWQDHTDDRVVDVESAAGLREAIDSGYFSLLLLEPVKGTPNTYKCLAGQIALPLQSENTLAGLHDSLGVMPTTDALARKREDAAQLPAATTLHSSGLFVVGGKRAPWIKDVNARMTGVYSLTARGETELEFSFALATDRLTAGEQQAWRRAWRDFGALLNPHNPLYLGATNAHSPTWFTLDVADAGALPSLVWHIYADESETLAIAPEQMQLLLSNRHPGDQSSESARAQTSIAGVRMESIAITSTETAAQIIVKAGKATSNNLALHYSWKVSTSGDAHTESFQSQGDSDFAFNPIETPALLRAWQEIPTPQLFPAQEESSDGEADDQELSGKPLAVIAQPDPVLWGYMPIAHGWAQLPIPNLTDQIYLKAKMANLLKTEPVIQTNVLEGAATYGNRDEMRSGEPEDEHAWAVVLTGCEALHAQWSLDFTDSARVAAVSATIQQPEITLDGFLWLSTSKPTAAEALPDSAGWIAPLHSIPLELVRKDRLYPPVVRCRLVQLEWNRTQTQEEQNKARPTLTGWKFDYTVDGDMEKRFDALPWQTEKKAPLRPAFWLRHPHLPMVQALPLTQTQSPPNHPGAGRQYAPFAPKPNGGVETKSWRFHSTSAVEWPTHDAPLIPNAEWKTNADLGLVSLSVPGLVLSPNDLPDTSDAVTLENLPALWRHDLPYLDQVNALAQLPKKAKANESVGANASVPEAEPLAYDNYVDHWQRLSTQASLAALYGTQAFSLSDEPTQVAGLVEPLLWPVSVGQDLVNYPGSITLVDSNNASELSLTGDAALEGISARFERQNDTLLREEDGAYEVVSGSMTALLEDGDQRDQRGLTRTASVLSGRGGLVRTPIRIERTTKTGALEEDIFALTSLTAPIALKVGDSDWHLWFRDLPVKDATFTRGSRTHDVNEPDAITEKNALLGYEWRLGSTKTETVPGKTIPLPLFGFDFYPLTLEKVTFSEESLTGAEMVGRMQLNFDDAEEADTLLNTVRLIFDDKGLHKIELPEGEGTTWRREWAFSNTPAGGIQPRLTWDRIKLEGDQIQVLGAKLEVTHFGMLWQLPFAECVFPASGSDYAPKGAQQVTKGPLTFTGDLLFKRTDAEAPRWRARTVAAQVALFDETTTPLNAKLTLDMIGGEWSCERINLLGIGASTTPVTDGPGLEAIVSHTSIALRWENLKSGNHCLLDGIKLASAGPHPGFGSFSLETFNNGTGLRLVDGFVESLLTCSWGAYMQEEASWGDGADAQERATERIYGASAGHLLAGYTAHYTLDKSAWAGTLLLNGYLEVKNLLSWPVSAIAGAAIVKPLKHIRHTARILLNQVVMQSGSDAPLKEETEGSNLFSVVADAPIQLPAVVEHQLAEVSGSAITRDRRWTALQTVALLSAGDFASRLGESRDAHPWHGIAGELTTALQADAGMLMIEATATHWIRQGRAIKTTQARPTFLQALPQGTMLSILSQSQDYVAELAADKKGWLLLPLPFHGRLRTPEATSPLRDPIQALEASVGAAAPPSAIGLAKALAHRGDTGKIHAVDSAVGRTWTQLDSAGLAESWARLQKPPKEGKNDSGGGSSAGATTSKELQSVAASLIDSPARLSRSAALGALLSASATPPFPLSTAVPPEVAEVAAPVEYVAELHEPKLRDRGDNVPDSTDNLLENWDFARNATAASNLANSYPHPLAGLKNPNRKDLIESGPEDNLPFLPPGWKVFSVYCGNYAGSDYQPKFRKWIEDSGWEDTVLPALNKYGYICMRYPKDQPERDLLALGMDKAFWIYSDRKTFDTDTEDKGWIKVKFGQQKTLESGRYRLSISIRSVHIPDHDPTVSVIKLFAGEESRKVPDLSKNRWQVIDWVFDVKDKAVGVGIELAHLKSMERNGWAVSEAVLTKVPVKEQTNIVPAEPHFAENEWNLAGPLILESGLWGDASDGGFLRFPSATLLPYYTRAMVESGMPVSLTVSPYLGISFVSLPTRKNEDAEETQRLELLSLAEMICLDATGAGLKAGATRLIDPVADSGSGLRPVPHEEWAKVLLESHYQHASLAILRLKDVFSIRNSAAAAVAYTFKVVEGIARDTLPGRKRYALRSSVENLRYREGQFGGQFMPVEIKEGAIGKISPIEIAPPQITGAQPLFFHNDAWPWDARYFRVAVRYTDPVVENGANESTEGMGVYNQDHGVLWWHAIQTMVQFRTAASDKPAAGLPQNFRAKAIKSLLPVIPAPEMPQELPANLAEGEWQSVLPGNLRYLLLGTRAGAYMAIRNQLITQRGIAMGDKATGETRPLASTLVSGSVPQQHRMPRPVALPVNRPGFREQALRPWASFFASEASALITQSPADEAFLAAIPPLIVEDPETPVAPGDPPAIKLTAAVPALGLRLVLESPLRGEISDKWDGAIHLSASTFADVKEPEEGAKYGAWLYTLELATPTGPLPSSKEKSAAELEEIASAKVKAPVGATIEKTLHEVKPDEAQRWIERMAAGETLLLRVHLTHTSDSSELRQTLTFPLYKAPSGMARLPLSPAFIQFEDPEYNRRLASLAARATGTYQPRELETPPFYGVTLATDRQEYDLNSTVMFRYDWEGAPSKPKDLVLDVKRLTEEGAPIQLAGVEKATGGKIAQFSMRDLVKKSGGPSGLVAGDILLLSLHDEKDVDLKEPILTLGVRIVGESVVPTPEAGYALLRYSKSGDSGGVECCRFAWSPKPSRIELVNAEDLRAEVVRRRAVFQWLDSARPNTNVAYAIQKIAMNGATHVPAVGPGGDFQTPR